MSSNPTFFLETRHTFFFILAERKITKNQFFFQIANSKGGMQNKVIQILPKGVLYIYTYIKHLLFTNNVLSI